MNIKVKKLQQLIVKLLSDKLENLDLKVIGNRIHIIDNNVDFEIIILHHKNKS